MKPSQSAASPSAAPANEEIFGSRKLHDVREALEITPAEGELLRLIERRPGLRVHAAASELGVASNSVSSLVKQLNRASLVQRASDPVDGRAACLRLTPLAEDWNPSTRPIGRCSPRPCQPWCACRKPSPGRT